jgi:hypothetical protein
MEGQIVTARMTARRGLRIFSRNKPVVGQQEMRRPPVWDQPAVDATPEFFAAGGSAEGVLFADPEGTEEKGLSLIWLRLGADYHLPRHSHSRDCLYYITAGEIRLGHQTLSTGEGFFVPADAPYTYIAGPQGAEILEFRGTSHPRETQILEKDWGRILQTCRANRDRWQDELKPWSHWMPSADTIPYQTPSGEQKSIIITR